MSSERTNLLSRLAADGGRYILAISLMPDEVEQAEKPTYGGKATSRFLTEQEYRAIFAGLHWLENQVGAEYEVRHYVNRCPHEWYQGRCVHCDVQAKDGKPAI